MRKKAYTLIELIFVIVIIGILSGTGFYYFKPHYLQNDRDFLELQLNTVRYQGVNFDKRNSSGIDYSIGCIAKDDFFTASSTIDKHYKKHSTFSISPDTDVLCFDTLGRLHDGNDDNNKTTRSSLIPEDINITLSYQNENKSIIIDHISGDLR